MRQPASAWLEALSLSFFLPSSVFFWVIFLFYLIPRTLARLDRDPSWRMSCHLPLWACRGIYPRNSGRGRCSTLGAGGMIISASILNALSNSLYIPTSAARHFVNFCRSCVECTYTVHVCICICIYSMCMFVPMRFADLSQQGLK